MKHEYELEVKADNKYGNDFIVIEANTRSQAVAMAKKQGYTVRSINMLS